MSLAFDEPDLESLVRQRIDSWRSGGAPDAAAFLDEHPELRRAKSLVLDLILEEYCLRREAGDEVAKGPFCDRFPRYRQSVSKMLEVQELLDRRPDIAARLDHENWPVSGDHFMGFDIIEPLGCGGLARAYLAREPALGNRPVVIKVSQHGAGEAATLGRLSHPNIVPVHSVLQDEVTGWTVICMPLLGTATAVDLLDAAFVGGQRPTSASIVSDVAQNVRPRGEFVGVPMPGATKRMAGTYGDAIARIGWRLAEGLAAAHAQGVLHRDIKPSNVLFDWSGQPLLLDFNLSADAELANERIGGTPAYMSPEAIASLMDGSREAAAALTPSSDVYSLGAVLYELLSGRFPLQPKNAQSLPRDAYQPWLDCKQSPPPALAPEIDPALAAIVQKCLAPAVAERYQTAEELAGELARFLGARPRVERFVKRHRRAVVAAGLCLLAFLGSASYALATRPAYEQRMLAEGLAQYERDELQNAELSFTRALTDQSDLAEARFARGQTYRRLEEWSKARDDFLACQRLHAGWAYAMAGECDIDLEDQAGARSDLRRAYQTGLRDIRFLLNYADVLMESKLRSEALVVYGDVLAVEPRNATALSNRALTYLANAMDGRAIPDLQAFEDVRQYCELDHESFKSCYLAARIFGWAAKYDATYREDGARYLTMALRHGLPREFVGQHGSLLKPLLTAESEELLQAAPAREPGFKMTYFQRLLPPDTAEWRQFLPQTR